MKAYLPAAVLLIFFIWRVAPYGSSDSIKDHRALYFSFLTVCAKQVQMNYSPIIFPQSLMILGASEIYERT